MLLPKSLLRGKKCEIHNLLKLEMSFFPVNQPLAKNHLKVDAETSLFPTKFPQRGKTSLGTIGFSHFLLLTESLWLQSQSRAKYLKQYQQRTVGGALANKTSGVFSHLESGWPSPPRPGQTSSTPVCPLSC